MDDELEPSRMPLLDHLVELRSRVMKATLGLAVGMVISLFFVQDLIREFRDTFDEGCATAEAQLRAGAYLLPEEAFSCELVIVNSPYEGVYTWLWTAFLGGLILAMPILAWQGWQFIAPGLYKSERRLVYPLTASSTGLFVMGAAFCYLVLLPIALPFFFTVIPGMATQLSVRAFLGGITTMMIAFGFCFQLPIVAWFLAKLGLIDHRDMIDGFRYAVVGIFLVAAFITPPDPLTQTALAIPLVILYGVGIVVARFSSTKVREPITEET